MPGNNDLNDSLFDHVSSDDAVDGIVDGLRAAIEATDGAEYETIINSRHTEKIVNKLLHCGVEEADIDIQRSWHIYGVDYRNDAPDPSALQPAALENIASPDSPIVESSARDYPTREDFYEFYLTLEIGTISGLENVFDMINDDFYTFLNQFYSQYAPREFEELYKQNVQLQRRLDTHSIDIDVRTIDFEERRELGRNITQMHQELSNDPLFDELLPQFIKFTDMLEDVYRRFENADHPYELGQAPEAGIDELERFYHRFAWKWVAELISKNTATGLDAGEIERTVEENELPGLNKTYDRRLSNLERQLLEWDQLPVGADTFTRPQSAEFDNVLEQLTTPENSNSEEEEPSQ
jgi:hypothetical protein